MIKKKKKTLDKEREETMLDDIHFPSEPRPSRVRTPSRTIQSAAKNPELVRKQHCRKVTTTRCERRDSKHSYEEEDEHSTCGDAPPSPGAAAPSEPPDWVIVDASAIVLTNP